MKQKIKFYTFAAILITIMAPFYLVGATFGQLVGALYFGYKEGRESFLRIIKKLQKGVKNEQHK